MPHWIVKQQCGHHRWLVQPFFLSFATKLLFYTCLFVPVVWFGFCLIKGQNLPLLNYITLILDAHQSTLLKHFESGFRLLSNHLSQLCVVLKLIIRSLKNSLKCLINILNWEEGGPRSLWQVIIIFLLLSWFLQEHIVDTCFIYLKNNPIYYIRIWNFDKLFSQWLFDDCHWIKELYKYFIIRKKCY